MSVQTEIERKFIIEKPSLEALAQFEGYSASEILQIYLENTERGATHRIRRRAFLGGAVEFTENTKERIDRMSVIEREESISEERFYALAKKIDKRTRPLKKCRYTVPFGGRTLEIDVYPEWEKSCILEIELQGREDGYELPDFIQVIKEVTGDKRYSNHSMSVIFPEEII